MSLQRIAFVAVLFGFSIVLTSCEQAAPKAKKKKEADPSVAEAIDAPLPPTGGDKSDPLGGDPDLPATPGGKTAPAEPATKIDPGTKVPKLPKFSVEGPSTPKTSADAGESVEHVQKPLDIPKAGVEAPMPKPQIVTLTYIGGAGNQWIQEVGFMEDGRIYAKSGGDTFTVYYSADGSKKLETTGDISKPCTGNRGPNLKTWGGGAYRASCPTSKVKLEIGTNSYGVTKAQPYLNCTSHDWKWWGWTLDDMGKGMEAAARGVGLVNSQNVETVDDQILAFLVGLFQLVHAAARVGRDPDDVAGLHLDRDMRPAVEDLAIANREHFGPLCFAFHFVGQSDAALGHAPDDLPHKHAVPQWPDFHRSIAPWNRSERCRRRRAIASRPARQSRNRHSCTGGWRSCPPSCRPSRRFSAGVFRGPWPFAV